MGAQERKRLKRIKKNVINRDGAVCCYCECPLTPETITMEHIVPNSCRGTFNSTNLTVSCATHNNERGNKSFFEYCKKFNWSKEKLYKYRTLYSNNLKIKVLNIAKEECLPKMINSDEEAIPLELIQKSCQILKIKPIDFSGYEKNFQFDINFQNLSNRKKIKYCFESLIKIIEKEYD